MVPLMVGAADAKRCLKPAPQPGLLTDAFRQGAGDFWRAFVFHFFLLLPRERY
jgi:hypothetical protein